MGGDTKVYVTSAQTDVTKINVTTLGWFNVTAKLIVDKIKLN